jgi:hypothetical protein
MSSKAVSDSIYHNETFVKMQFWLTEYYWSTTVVLRGGLEGVAPSKPPSDRKICVVSHYAAAGELGRAAQYAEQAAGQAMSVTKKYVVVPGAIS